MTHRCFRRASDVRASISDDGLVLLDVRGGLVLASNPTGARIWELIEARRSVPDIARQLADDHQIPIEQASRDVSAFVDALVGRQLIAEDGTDDVD